MTHSVGSLFLAAATTWTLLLSPAPAAPADKPAAPEVTARLLADAAAVQSGKSFRVGVPLTIEKDWHVYWKNPGDAGLIVYRGAIDNAPMGSPPAGAARVNYVEKVLDELLAAKPVSIPETKAYGCSVKYAP